MVVCYPMDSITQVLLPEKEVDFKASENPYHDSESSAKSHFEERGEGSKARRPEIELRDTNTWPRVSTTLRHYDENRAQDCNENIDTLLAFVGARLSIAQPAFLSSISPVHSGNKKTPLSSLFVLCRIVFLCAGMAAEGCYF